MSAVRPRRQLPQLQQLPDIQHPAFFEEDQKYHASTPFLPSGSWTSSLLSTWRSRFRSLRSLCRRRAVLLSCFGCLALTLTTIILYSRAASQRTLVYRQDDLQRIWQWEIASGHHPSRREVPDRVKLLDGIENPALPFEQVPGDPNSYSTGLGPRRHYVDIRAQAKVSAYPPRPAPGSVADFDIIFDHCDFSQKKLVRDCLAFLRAGGGLDHGKRPRKHIAHAHNQRNADERGQYIFTLKEHDPSRVRATNAMQTTFPAPPKRAFIRSDREGYMAHEPFVKKHDAAWEVPLNLPLPRERGAASSQKCNPNDPRLFHMYWTGPFTDKPYISLLSFLYTQNTALHNPSDDEACHPKLLMWINPGSATSMQKIDIQELHEQLKANEWSAPFLHPRFAQTIQFKLWNTAERLDSIPELKDDWRNVPNLFNSGGDKLKPQAASNNGTVASATPKTYDRHSVTLSDIARFVLCHHFGGVYLDADTVFLRDWEELWGWGGAFAYRWSFHDKYNTAVLRLNKRSALGTFIIRTALKNDFNFHPMKVTTYLKEAHLDHLLYRVPDAVFDSAWMNTEGYQRDTPPQPYFKQFEEFFDSGSSAPQALGFDGFFRGAYSYHYHNKWWKAIDPDLNRPDLGPEFESSAPPPSSPEDTSTDLAWSAVLKRTCEEYIRGERPNMYGEWLEW